MVKRKRPICYLEEISEPGILSSILSLLPLRDAVRTSVLSSTWRHTWKSISNLSFDSKDMFGCDTLNMYYKIRDRERYFAALAEIAEKFVASVDAVIQQHRGTGVVTLKFECVLHNNKYAEYIDKWIDLGISSTTKELVLNFGLQTIEPLESLGEPYDFPCHRFTGQRGLSIERLRLFFCSLKPPPRFDGFHNLKSLDLENVDISESDIHYFLSTCSFLERLSIVDSEDLVNLKIPHDLDKLRYVNLGWCTSLRKVEVYAINITTFKYRGHTISLIFGEVPQLTETHTYFDDFHDVIDTFRQLPGNLPHVKTLCLEMSPYKQVADAAKGFSKFAFLKHLVLFMWFPSHACLLWVASLLDAAPFLEKFELHLKYGTSLKYGPRRSITRLCNSTHSHLKTAEISGFTGAVAQIELAIYLLSHASALELMIIDPRMKRTDEWERKSCTLPRPGSRRIARKYLKKEVPSNVELKIL